MPDFGDMANKAKDFAGDHDKQSDEALDKADKFADDKTGNKYDSQIQSGEDKAEGYLGVEDQDKAQDQGQQNQDQQNQGSN
jgi:MT0933-like antitoxin protein